MLRFNSAVIGMPSECHFYLERDRLMQIVLGESEREKVSLSCGRAVSWGLIVKGHKFNLRNVPLKAQERRGDGAGGGRLNFTVRDGIFSV